MRCPFCGSPNATYQAFSGGREGWCPDEKTNFLLSLLPDEEQPRAALLQTEDGRVALRAMLDQELARKRDDGLHET